MGLGACHALLLWGVHDKAMKVNEHIHAAPVLFHEAVEEGI